MGNRVLVFKTNIEGTDQASKLEILRLRENIYDWSIDLDDHDNILRVEGYNLRTRMIVKLINELGFACQLIARGH
ncbi:hypothetical protein [Fodinibius sediminis]|nr:hypothetical protein [Fodinibius sediminis]